MKKKIWWLILLFFISDLVFKQVIIHFIDLGHSVTIIPKFFYLTYVQNNGAAFSIFQNQQMLIMLITVIALFYIYKCINQETLKKYEVISYSMITGGILGNLFDRLVFGYVIDFLDFQFGSYHYPVFNLADCFIVIGVIILIIYMFIEWREERGNSSQRKKRKN